MSGKKGCKQMNSKEWETIKVLTNTDLSDTMVASILNRGVSTANRVRASASFDDYVSKNREDQQRYKDTQVAKSSVTAELIVSEPTKTETETAVFDTESMISKLDTIIALLQNIAELAETSVAHQYAAKNTKWF